MTMTINKFGTVDFEGKTYTLTSEAWYTNRKLPSNYTDYNDACEGETYDFEMSCTAIDEEGNKVEIFWIFQAVKGYGFDLDEMDYDNVNRIE